MASMKLKGRDVEEPLTENIFVIVFKDLLSSLSFQPKAANGSLNLPNRGGSRVDRSGLTQSKA